VEMLCIYKFSMFSPSAVYITLLFLFCGEETFVLI
jgi:hypothetical protein